MKAAFIARAVSVLIIMSVLAAGWWLVEERRKFDAILDYNQCVAAGYPIQESAPPKCALPDGRTFTQAIPTP